ncbi:hypothetical protein CXB51_035588 [Gossypium anomalum]|uniref:Large ribosomal subunit protein uL2 RNA-binding domain-containing protein n=1 Tax=Gossypium anomalum TaxID=47600 RepID=A0A8J5XRG6_9ROSI|nr:hypothetical protein CXB51_035588 [Gossypium anomalum]
MKHITLWQGNVSQFNESSTYLMGWLRDYLWLNSSQLINGYNPFGMNSLSVWAWMFLFGHLVWATGFMFSAIGPENAIAMAIHLYKTSTSGTRNGAIDSKHRCGKGRNARGIITTRHRRGGHKCLYRKIDFRRNEKDIYGRIVTIEYDPNRNAYICLIHYRDGEKRYILHPRGAIIGDTISVPINRSGIDPGRINSRFIDNP